MDAQLHMLYGQSVAIMLCTHWNRIESIIICLAHFDHMEKVKAKNKMNKRKLWTNSISLGIINNLTKTDKTKTYYSPEPGRKSDIQLYCKFEFEFEW